MGLFKTVTGAVSGAGKAVKNVVVQQVIKWLLLAHVVVVGCKIAGNALKSVSGSASKLGIKIFGTYIPGVIFKALGGGLATPFQLIGSLLKPLLIVDAVLLILLIVMAILRKFLHKVPKVADKVSKKVSGATETMTSFDEK